MISARDCQDFPTDGHHAVVRGKTVAGSRLSKVRSEPVIVSEMHAVVHEGWPLFGVTDAVLERDTDGREVTHGPWVPSECQAVLVAWHEAGWIDLVADAERPSEWGPAMTGWPERAPSERTFPVLTTMDARELLSQPARWLVGTEDGHVMPSVTRLGESHAFEEWKSLAVRG
jgi:hypothetical protein